VSSAAGWGFGPAQGGGGGGGGPTGWGVVLGVGAITDGANPTLSSGDILTSVADLAITTGGTGGSNLNVKAGPNASGTGGQTSIDGGNATTTDNDGGGCSSQGGEGFGSGSGGNGDFLGGIPGPTGDGGSVQMQSGRGGLTSGRSGNADVSTDTTVDGVSGNVTIGTGNSSGGTNDSGLVSIDTGTSAGGTTGVINVGTGNASALNLSRTGQNVNIDGNPVLVEIAAPGTPAANRVVFYAKAGLVYSKDDAGVETLMSGGSGSGAAVDDANSILAGQVFS